MAWANFDDPVYSAIKAFFIANWPHTPIKWPNEQAEIPPASPYVAVEIEGRMYGQESIGASLQHDNRWDQEGLVWFHLMTPTGTGNENISGAADAIMQLFRGLTLNSNNLEFGLADKGAGGPGDERGNWFRVSVNIEWRNMNAT